MLVIKLNRIEHCSSLAEFVWKSLDPIRSKERRFIDRKSLVEELATFSVGERGCLVFIFIYLFTYLLLFFSQNYYF